MFLWMIKAGIFVGRGKKENPAQATQNRIRKHLWEWKGISVSSTPRGGREGEGIGLSLSPMGLVGLCLPAQC